MERCLFCNQPATRLCDRVIGMVDAGERVKVRGRPAYSVTSMEAMLSVSYTCDAPICAEHTRVVGHVCGKDHDTIDHCVGCCGAARANELLTPAAIESRRARMHATYRRGRVKSVGLSLPEGIEA